MKFPYRNVVVLTGAGISAESGIQTFRAQDGLWEDHRIEDVATPEGFDRNPDLVQDFYNQRRLKLQEEGIEPNAAHLALARLEKELEGTVTIITQNIDNLHERGGSVNVIHMHGELLKARCSESNQVVEEKGEVKTGDLCHCCQIPSQMRPHVVWFGEMPLRMGDIYESLEKADLFISIGTSGVVYPAAGFVHDAKMHGAHTLEINLEPSAVESEFEEKRYGKASIEVPKLVEEILALQEPNVKHA
ncbi:MULTISPECIES: Sir2 family NAD+-dependent deacetylase [unclassified Vibrio]|uniref:Sir2 family NAD+-dependent deacetylase n=1 Tax=unclassified Vibrio TaxID=2614977 RepID=UPI0001B93C38|nr:MULTISPECIES: Sir2 family NAD+-dependent deacetylase [unclassified Vibrio]EEX31143.1 NAD-dependent protein deacetylase of SIR2 family [Vibrio coralliilyticus ATCC BAA-450]MCM5507242.1 NAD-dependent protein deacylase [Vibrio sp. SCSIO 43169]MDE3896341.1 NAD-dependent protein deacylase [Vibrio sp. CC007]QFT36461.1 NAD-dependent protein deacylase [Vibrio sp. THAF64]QGM34362.1 NAD-dependent protein deacylase [Vibrio sp. THAF191d]